MWGKCHKARAATNVTMGVCVWGAEGFKLAPTIDPPAKRLTGDFFIKIAGAIAITIISRIAQIVRRSMDSVHSVRGQGRTRPDETDDSGRDGERPARCP